MSFCVWFCQVLRSIALSHEGRTRTLLLRFDKSSLQPSQPSCFPVADANGFCRAPIIPWIYGSYFQWHVVAGHTNQVFARVPKQFLRVGGSVRKGGFRQSNNCTSLHFAACATLPVLDLLYALFGVHAVLAFQLSSKSFSHTQPGPSAVRANPSLFLCPRAVVSYLSFRLSTPCSP